MHSTGTFRPAVETLGMSSPTMLTGIGFERLIMAMAADSFAGVVSLLRSDKQTRITMSEGIQFLDYLRAKDAFDLANLYAGQLFTSYAGVKHEEEVLRLIQMMQHLANGWESGMISADGSFTLVVES